ncbi:MAG: ribulose-phosphate 3-epimerase, partial [Patescibacteria group bacterium]|jgi:ribulose-phosphate 3-epimerase
MLDYVQLMTVAPGAQGRQFKSAVLNKMLRFKTKYPNVRIQADGGINERTLPFVLDSGADDVIIGSALFRSGNPIQVLRTLQETMTQ